MLQLKMKKDTNNYFSRVLNKSTNYFMVWHGNCYSSTPADEFTGFRDFLDENLLKGEKNLKINGGLVNHLNKIKRK